MTKPDDVTQEAWEIACELAQGLYLEAHEDEKPYIPFAEYPTIARAIMQAEKRGEEQLKVLEAECWDLRCISSPIADTGDADIEWVVISHHMASPRERVVGRGPTPRQAIVAAMQGERSSE